MRNASVVPHFQSFLGDSRSQPPPVTPRSELVITVLNPGALATLTYIHSRSQQLETIKSQALW